MKDIEKDLEASNESPANDQSSSKSQDSYQINGIHKPELEDNSNDINNGTAQGIQCQTCRLKNVQAGDETPLRDSLIEWEGDNDPENPLNWTTRRKVWMSVVASFMTFGVSFASSVFSACTEVTAEEFGVSDEVMVLGVSLYVLGFACGK